METVTAIGGVSRQVEEIPSSPVNDGSGGDHVDEWCRWLELSRGLLPNTIKLYRSTVEAALRDEIDLENATSQELQRWVQGKGGGAATIGNRICALTSFYRFLVKFGYRLDNPALELDRPKQRRGVPKPVANLETVYKTCDSEDRRSNLYGVHKRPEGQTRMMAQFLANTGLRIHEAVALSVPVPAPRSITIIGKGAKEAIVPLNDKAREALDFLGGRWPIGARATQRRFEKVATKLGIRFHPHALRHTFCTNLVKAGVEIGTVSKLARHSSPTTTMGYSMYAQEKLESAVDLL